MKTYVLFEWVEERETKNIFGVYSSLEVAQNVAQRVENSDYEGVELEWRNFEYNVPVWTADNSNPFGEAFEINEFEVDM